MISNPLGATKKNKYIHRKDLFKINEIMENSETIVKKVPNQGLSNDPHIYKFSMDEGLIAIK